MKTPGHRLLSLVALAAVLMLAAVTPAARAGGGFSYALPPNYLKVQSEKRNNVFYIGEPVTLKLSDLAASYEVRDYYGNLVDQGTPSQGTSINPNVTAPGWYKLYVYGSLDQGAPWGKVVGGTMFCIFRNKPNFPSLPPPDGNPYNDTDDEVMRGVTGMGPQRHYINDAANPDADIAQLQRLIAIDKQMYLPFDPVRKRKLLIAFPNGTANLAGVRKVVDTFKNDVEYFEPRNEPNFGSYGGDFVNNELKPFYQTVKSVSPALKVLGPGIVTIGPYGLNWIKDFLSAGGANYVDGFSFHAYNNVNGDPFLAQESIDGLNNLLAQYNAAGLEKWQTEQGYMAAVYGSYQPRLQGRWTMVQMMVYEQNGIPKEHNHLWYDVSRGYWAFPMFWENEDSSLNPAAPLMRVWSEELYGTTFATAFDFGQPGNHIYLGSLFTGPGKSVAAFMSWGSTDGRVELTVSSGNSIHYVTSFGIEYDLPVAQGRVTIPVPELPVYVELAAGQTISVVPTNWGPNLALQSGVSGKSSGTGAHPVYPGIPNSINKLFNGVLENWYYQQTDADRPWMDNTQGFPAWVEMDMPSSQTIDHVVVYGASPWQLDGTLIDYELQATINGQWVTLDHVQEPVNTFKVYTPVARCSVDSFFSDRWVFQHSFTPVQTQKIRLLVHNATYGGGATKDVADAGGQTGAPNICLREIEVYNSSAVPPLPGTPTPGTPSANIAPLVSIYSPVNSTVFSSPANIKVSAGAFDPDGQIAKVEFFANNTKLGESTSGQFIFSWNDVPQGSYTLTATATDNSGARTASSPVNITVGATGNVPGPITGSGSGLLGQYFADSNLTIPQSTWLDAAVDFDFGNPAVTNFSARWNGLIEPKYSETYTFYTQSDDGARLWIDGQQLVNDWNIHSVTENSGTINLLKGHRYELKLEYFQQGGGAAIKLFWSSPSQPKEIVPTSQLYPPLSISSPADGSVFTAPASILVAAGNVASSGTVTKVEFFAGNTKIGEAGAAPYSITWNKPPPGKYALTAKATKSDGSTVTSSPVNITINAAPLGTSASYMKTDTTTQGNWKPGYGTDGFQVIGTNAGYPSYATVTPTGNLTYTWVAPTQDSRALQNNTGTDRIAACWYSQGSSAGNTFSVDVNLTDGQLHTMALYALDWDNFTGGRLEKVEIIDPATGLVLDSRTLSDFQGGKYLVWNVSGHVLIRVTNNKAGANAVVSGLFFSTKSNATVSFVKTDTTTQGNWKGVYGADGFNVFGDVSNYPSYSAITATGNSSYTWVPSTSDNRALQKSTGSDRIAACWYSQGSSVGNTFSIDVDLSSDGQIHPVALYALDWDGFAGGRSEKVEIIDPATGILLDSQTLSDFQGGKYLVWNVSGHVLIRVTNNKAGANAVVGGLFFSTTKSTTASFAYVKNDTSTQGNWKGVYGVDGFAVFGDTTAYPSYAAIATNGSLSYTWAGSTSDVRALRKSSGQDRVAACLYSQGISVGSSFNVDVNLLDSQTHSMAIYALDWDGFTGGRSQTVDILDAATGASLDHRSLSLFQGGSYLVWNVTGHVLIKVTNQKSNANAVISGLFFGPAAAAP